MGAPYNSADDFLRQYSTDQKQDMYYQGLPFDLKFPDFTKDQSNNDTSDIDREARAKALIALGAPLLAAGGTRNPGALLSQGLTNFTNSITESEQATRQAKLDELKRQQVNQEIEASKHAESRADTESQQRQSEFERANAERESANGVVSGLRDIITEKNPDSPEALKLGVFADSDNPHLFVNDAIKEYNQWASINNMPTITAAEIEAKHAEITAGVMADPRRQQDIEEKRAGLEAANIGSEISHRTWEEQHQTGIENASRVDAMLQHETDELFNKSIAERDGGLGKPGRFQRLPNGTAIDSLTGKTVSQDTIPSDDQLRQRAAQQAQINVQRRMQSARIIQGNVALIPGTVQKIQQKLKSEPVDQVRREMAGIPGMSQELIERYINAAGNLQ